MNTPKENEKDLEKVIENQINENIDVIESLRDYDAGKKEISTADIERDLPNIRVSSKA